MFPSVKDALNKTVKNRLKNLSANRRQPLVAALKKLPCRECGNYGHWKEGHNSDGFLKSDVKFSSSSDKFIASLEIIKTTPSKPENNSGLNDSKKKTISFDMAKSFAKNARARICVSNKRFIGPLVDDGARYSAIDMAELKFPPYHLSLGEGFDLNTVPTCLNGYTHWQYGSGSHASSTRKIFGSEVLEATSNNALVKKVRHLVLEGSSHWVIGKLLPDMQTYCMQNAM